MLAARKPRFTHLMQHLSESRYKALVVQLLLCSLLLPAYGCRSLRTRRQTAALATARQLSRQGAGELQQQKYGEAAIKFQEALDYSDADERAHRGFAEVLWQQNEFEEASQHMATAARISGDSPDLLVRLGEMYFERGLYDQALAQADLALNVERRHYAAWALRGQVLHAQNQLDEALVAYHRAMNERENYPEVQIAVAKIYQSIGRPQRSLNTLKRMMDTSTGQPIPAEAWLLRGRALADLDQQDDARLCLRKASQGAQQEDTELLVELAQCHIQFGDLAEARHCIGRAAQHDPYNPDVQRVKLALDDTFQNYTAVSTLVGFGQAVPNDPPLPQK